MPGIIIIGGGAAGMMAAAAAASAGAQVCLLEKNGKLGKKLFLTGKGRCNVTNAADMETLFENVCTNAKFLYSAFYQFDNRAVMEFFERCGCPLKVERGDRVFPVSDRASDVTAALERELGRRKVEVRLNTAVQEIVADRPGTAGEGTAVKGVKLADGRFLPAKAVVVCTGGLSYPLTGSDGDGFVFAKKLGHEVTECRPSLVPLETAEEWCRKLQGLSLKNVSLCMMSGGKTFYKEQGEMLFTHFGVSGPLVLSASSLYYKALSQNNECHASRGTLMFNNGCHASRDILMFNNECHASGDIPMFNKGAGPVLLYIDLKPALDAEQLDRRLLRDFGENKNRQFQNALGGLFPAKLIPVMVRLSGIDPEKRVHEVSREERRSFGELIKNLPLTVTGTRSFAEAVITQGGVMVKEVNPSTMESKRVKGLYFAGEVLDVDARTGGYNLQIAWSTGHLAGRSAALSAGGT